MLLQTISSVSTLLLHLFRFLLLLIFLLQPQLRLLLQFLQRFLLLVLLRKEAIGATT